MQLDTLIENKQTNIMNLDVTEGFVSADYWPTDRIMLIPMKDGTYALGINVIYPNADGSTNNETLRIMLSEDNIPYVEIGGSPYFTEENCDMDISSFNYSNTNGHHHVVNGYPLLTLDDGSVKPAQSVFEFIGNSLKEPTIREYFAGYYKTAGFNPKSLAIIEKFINSDENKSVLYERIRRPSKKELKSLQDEIHHTLDEYFAGKVSQYSMKTLLNTYDLISRSNGMNPNSLIKLDLADLEHLLAKPQGQPE
jgi:hypothetical protein